MNGLPAGVDPGDDIAVTHLADYAAVHRPDGCAAARKIAGPYMGAWQTRVFSVFWCPHAACFPTAPAPKPWPSNGGGHSSPRFSPSPSREVIPHAQRA